VKIAANGAGKDDRNNPGLTLEEICVIVETTH